MLLAILASSASAYTLVLRDGRHLEIPSEFTVTKTAVRYELAPGMQKSLLMTVIDVGATERPNNEPLGSFLKRADKSASTSEAPANPDVRRSITNRDLEDYALPRLELVSVQGSATAE